MIMATTSSTVSLIVLTLLCNQSYQENVKEDEKYWKASGQDAIRRSQRIFENINTKVAKNIIIFIGDGMSNPTVTAARLFKAQQVFNDFNRSESHWLTFERFEHLGHSKTYSIDEQIADSASTASAIFSGVKTKYGTLGYDDSIDKDDVNSMLTANKVESILTWAQNAGKYTGIVTTARLTHATPAALYAHTYDRNWESDSRYKDGNATAPPPQGLHDIAWQLVHASPGNRANVLLGGGYPAFHPEEKKQQLRKKYGAFSEDWGEGFRRDRTNLVEEWLKHQKKNSKFVSNKAELMNVHPEDTDYLLGLFSENHMEYHDRMRVERDPTLANMTQKAIQILKKNSNGFFLMVESARIDHAHHETKANRALSETVALDLAVEVALDELGREQDETLIIVTADHAHTMSMAGYSARGNDIRGLAQKHLDDSLPYTTLSYANGDGYYLHNLVNSEGSNVTRLDLTTIPQESITAFDFVQTSSGPRNSETHGGDDVAIFAKGPMAHLFHSTHEQTHIAYVMAYSACIGPYQVSDSKCQSRSKASSTINSNCSFISILLLFLWNFA